jgi:hypothetical protein
MRPATTEQPFATRTTPPVATVRNGSSANGLATASSACGSRIESASTMQISCCWAMLMPVLTASVLPPFSLRTTISGSGRRRGTYTPSTAPNAGTSGGTTRGVSTRSNSARNRSNVASVEPSSMTITSNCG